MTTPPIVYAYLDPGTGSYLLQLALAGMLAASYAVKHFWARIKSVFTRSSRSTPDDVRG
jgi:hypothetical protein